MGERDEDFLRIADDAALAPVPNGSGSLKQGRQFTGLHQEKRLFARDASALFGTRESGLHTRQRDGLAYRDASHGGGQKFILVCT